MPLRGLNLQWSHLDALLFVIVSTLICFIPWSATDPARQASTIQWIYYQFSIGFDSSTFVRSRSSSERLRWGKRFIVLRLLLGRNISAIPEVFGSFDLFGNILPVSIFENPESIHLIERLWIASSIFDGIRCIDSPFYYSDTSFFTKLTSPLGPSFRRLKIPTSDIQLIDLSSFHQRSSKSSSTFKFFN